MLTILSLYLYVMKKYSLRGISILKSYKCYTIMQSVWGLETKYNIDLCNLKGIHFWILTWCYLCWITFVMHFLAKNPKIHGFGGFLGFFLQRACKWCYLDVLRQKQKTPKTQKTQKTIGLNQWFFHANPALQT